jgi:peptidoglycan/LPS O-acetylase OafA/YrhL
MSRASAALENLRGFVVLMVLAFHSFMAYMVSLPVAQTPFDAPPYDWTAHPIIDNRRWLGFDLFGAFQFLHLMQVMFLLSGLFVWPSLARKGTATFVRDRFWRLGVPFIFGVFVLMPVAYFPVYRVGAVDASWSAFWSHWTALSFWPSGPIWFLWYLLALNLVAAAVYTWAPRSGELLRRLSDYAGRQPSRFFMGLVVVSALAYLPTAGRFAPWSWVEFGPFAIQPGFALQYAVYFCAGLAIGVHGIERGFFGEQAMLAQRWAIWLAAMGASFVLWIVPAALIAKGQDAGAPALPIARELGLVLFAASACFGLSAVFLRFAAKRRPILGRISDHAYGIYLFHYVFVIWAQYALLDVPLPAIGKGAIVLAVTLAMSWTLSAAVNSAPLGARLMRGERRAGRAQAPTTAKRNQSQLGVSE